MVIPKEITLLEWKRQPMSRNYWADLLPEGYHPYHDSKGGTVSIQEWNSRINPTGERIRELAWEYTWSSFPSISSYPQVHMLVSEWECKCVSVWVRLKSRCSIPNVAPPYVDCAWPEALCELWVSKPKTEWLAQQVGIILVTCSLIQRWSLATISM